MLNGRQAIHDALVKQSLELADRPEFFYMTLWNPSRKGEELFILLVNTRAARVFQSLD